MKNISSLLYDRGTVFCRLPAGSGKWALFHSPERIISVSDIPGVYGAIKEIEKALQEGYCAAGYISYTAAPAFDSANSVISSPGVPLLWFGVYKHWTDVSDFNDIPAPAVPENSFVPEISLDDYITRIGKIKNYIKNGDIYQANFTFRMFSGEQPFTPEFFISLFNAHPVPYAAYINAGSFQVISMSPELFLERNGKTILSVPMKGTAPRHPLKYNDRRIVEELSRDSKNTAENLMITDMVRNDLGRICSFGSVKTGELFRVETYPTLHQMVSSVKGELKNGTTLWDILKASFPAASITGAPKIRSMRIIKELELDGRGVYTGTAGCFISSGDFCLNVAIRTIVNMPGHSEIGVGGGIVADSTADSEWREALLKSRFLYTTGDFKTLETILWCRVDGFEFLDEHLKRARETQEYFHRKWDEEFVREKLQESSEHFSGDFQKVRLLVDRKGNPEIQSTEMPFAGWRCDKLKVKISDKRTDSSDLFLYHKTTKRKLYDTEFRKALAGGCDEVLFMNENGEITEGAISSIFIKKQGVWYTPGLDSGILPGIWRAYFMKINNAVENVLTPEDLMDADEVIIGNSVRMGGRVSFL